MPPEVVTLTFADPDALGEIANVAVSWVALMTFTLLTDAPLLTFTVVPPVTKFVPVNVTLTLVPAVPLVGLIEVSVGCNGGAP